MNTKKYLIFDYGASMPLIVALYNGSTFEMEEIHEYDNRPVAYARHIILGYTAPCIRAQDRHAEGVYEISGHCIRGG